ncbi:MAG TPA: PIN domain-containing protein [Tepidisphaeraceae bacterium]|jgi:PIN domain nuclease of toxin-antitoxin system|nr:PIN domain-containing protein [Tepidisphaeraceae bacterium]
MKIFLPDTHVIYWYEFQNPKLSSAALQTFKEAEAGNALPAIHPIVLAEFYWILKKAGFETKFLQYVQFVRGNPVYRYASIDLHEASRLDDFREISQMHDRLIAIVAERLNATIVTTDPAILQSTKVKSVW